MKHQVYICKFQRDILKHSRRYGHFTVQNNYRLTFIVWYYSVWLNTCSTGVDVAGTLTPSLLTEQLITITITFLLNEQLQLQLQLLENC